MKKGVSWIAELQFGLVAVVLYTLLALTLLGDGGSQSSSESEMVVLAVAFAVLVLGLSARAIYKLRNRHGV